MPVIVHKQANNYMFKTIKQLLASFLMTLVLTASSTLLPASAYAQTTAPWDGVCVSQEITNGEETKVATIQGIQCIIANIFSIAISVIGLLGFVMFIVGSFKYLLSGGNSKGVESARNTFSYAVIGLVVALSSIIIINLVAAFTGVNTILNFVIPSSECGLSVEC